jgi:predicted porin
MPEARAICCAPILSAKRLAGEGHGGAARIKRTFIRQGCESRRGGGSRHFQRYERMNAAFCRGKGRSRRKQANCNAMAEGKLVMQSGFRSENRRSMNRRPILEESAGAGTILKRLGISAAMLLSVAGVAQAADLPTSKPAPAPPPPTLASCATPWEFISTNCPLTYYGITLYGTIDVGVDWQSHGTKLNAVYPTGIEELVSKNSNKAIWNLAPNGLSQSNIGIKGKEDFAPGWSFVFDLNMGFDPYTLQLANGPKSQLENNGLPLALQNSNGDSSRAGQFYNGVGFAGLSSTTFGTLTFGRQNSLTLDGVNTYDPMGGSYAFSPIGYSGATAGIGDTEDARYTTAFKYRVDVGMFRAAALYQFGGYGLGNASSDAYQFQVGGDYASAYGKLSLDAIYSRVNDAVSTASLSAAQNVLYPSTLAATISDDTSVMLLAKYTTGPFKVFGGYEHITFAPPSNPQTTFTDIGGYTVVSADITNTAYSVRNRILQVLWTGGRYAFNDNLDVGVGYYHYIQNDYLGGAGCNNSSSSKCSGTMDAVSGDVDWQFAKKFDAYAGMMFSEMNNGLANGFLHHTNIDPTVGLRFRF